MIRVGNQKPKLYFVPAHNDMSHFIPSHYATNDFYYMGLMEYIEKREFDTFNMKPNISSAEMYAILKASREGQEISYFESPWASQMYRLIKKAHGQVWQFNAVSSDLTGYVRQVVCLGEKQMTQWTWFDANVKLPILKFTASILNRLRKQKTDKEWADWQVFLNSIHNKAK